MPTEKSGRFMLILAIKKYLKQAVSKAPSSEGISVWTFNLGRLEVSSLSVNFNNYTFQLLIS